MKKLTKNKKIILAIVAAVLCVATVLSIVIVNASMNPLEKFALKIMKKQNFQMDIVLSGIPIFGAVALTCEVDGDVQHIPAANFISESYIEKVGDKQYTYAKDSNGKWTKTEGEASDMLSGIQSNDLLKDLMNLENYEEVEGKKNVYRQKEDVTFESFKNVTITLEKDSCTIEMILYTGGMALDAVIAISNIGKMNVTLPSVD